MRLAVAAWAGDESALALADRVFQLDNFSLITAEIAQVLRDITLRNLHPP